MQKIFFIILFFISLSGYSNKDSINVDTTKCKIESFYEVNLSSRNIWRGIDFGNYSPCVFGLVGITYKKLEIGAYGITSLTGTNIGYGNTFNVYSALKFKYISFYIEDYYFNGDISNIQTDYLDWNNTHFLENRIKIEHKGFHLIGGYTLAGGKFYNITSPFNNTQAVYLEVGYKLKHWSLSIGGITGPSALNFHDKEGITNILLKHKSEIQKLGNLPVEIGMCYNPNYNNIAPKGIPRYGYGNNAFNFLITIILI